VLGTRVHTPEGGYAVVATGCASSQVVAASRCTSSLAPESSLCMKVRDERRDENSNFVLQAMVACIFVLVSVPEKHGASSFRS